MNDSAHLARKRRFSPGLFAALLLSLPSAIWIALDRSVWEWDASYYGAEATNLWWELSHHHLWAWLSNMQTAFGIKAPGIAWFGQFFVPLGNAFGSVESGLLVFIWLNLVAALWLMYEVGRAAHHGSPAAGWLTAGITASAPLTLGMSHKFFTEIPELCAVAYIFWIAVALPGASRLRLAAHTLLATALGMLAKATFPLYVIAPVVIIACRWRSESRPSPPSAPSRKPWALLVIAAAIALIAADWYLANFRAVLSFVQLASSSQEALHYGHVGSLSSKLGYWLLAARQAFIAPGPGLIMAGALAASAGIVAARWWRIARPSPPLDGSLAAGSAAVPAAPSTSPAFKAYLASSSLAQLIFVLLFFSRQINEETRYLLPILPAAALSAVALLMNARSRVVLATATLAVVWQFFLVQQIAFGPGDPNPALSPHLVPLHVDGGARDEIDRVAALTAGDRVSIVGVELPWLGALTLSFHAAKLRLHTNRLTYYDWLSANSNDPALAQSRVDGLNGGCFITLSPAHQPSQVDFLNPLSLEIYRYVTQSKLFQRIPFPSTLGIEIYRRLPDHS